MTRERVWNRRPPPGSEAERHWLIGNAIRKHRRGEPPNREEMNALVGAAWSLVNAERGGLDVQRHLKEQGLDVVLHQQHLARVARFGSKVRKPSLAIARAKLDRSKRTAPMVDFFLAAGAPTVHEAARQAAAVLGSANVEN